MGDEVLYERRGVIGLVTMNRPRYRNASSNCLIASLEARIASALCPPKSCGAASR